MPSQGPLYPATVTNTALSGSSANWDNPGNAVSSNNSYATATLGGGQYSAYLKASGFGFSIPDGATIDGVVVEYEAHGTVSGTAKDYAVRLVRADGTIGSTDRADTANNWGTADNVFLSRGGASDLWGETLTPADVNGPDFGCALSCQRVGGTMPTLTGNCDSIRMTVYYTEGGGLTAELESVTPADAHPGDEVTLSGAGFTGAQAVKFRQSDAVGGEKDAVSFQVVNDSTITAILPNNVHVGTVAVTITAADDSTLDGPTITVERWKVRLNWEHPDPESVKFHISKSVVAGSAPNGIGTPPLGATTYLDANVLPGYTYRYSLRACNRTSDRKCSGESNTVTITIPGVPPVEIPNPDAPTGLTAELE